MGGAGDGGDDGVDSRLERRASWAVAWFGGADVDDAAFHQSAGVDILDEKIGNGRKKAKAIT